MKAAPNTVKQDAGTVGKAYAPVADALESTAELLASLVVFGRHHATDRRADEDHPFCSRERPRGGP